MGHRQTGKFLYKLIFFCFFCWMLMLPVNVTRLHQVEKRNDCHSLLLKHLSFPFIAPFFLSSRILGRGGGCVAIGGREKSERSRQVGRGSRKNRTREEGAKTKGTWTGTTDFLGATKRLYKRICPSVRPKRLFLQRCFGSPNDVYIRPYFLVQSNE